MDTYVIEREIEGIEGSTAEDLRAISKKSKAVLDQLGSGIEWVHSYVAEGKIYCVYRAQDEEIIREHARQGGFPADSIRKVANTISPATAAE